MTLIDLAKTHLPGLQKESARSWAGPCPKCGGEDRFVVGGKKEMFHCRGCGAAGDAVALLRLLGRSCPEAHAELGRRCDSSTCRAERCPARSVNGGRAGKPVRALRTPTPASAASFTPAEAETPAERWRKRAAKLIAHAHEALLGALEPLAYLAGRGLPREAVERYRLGWLAKDYYRSRAVWGLPEERRADGRLKQLGLPAGIVIPFFDAEGEPARLRIRRAQVRDGMPRYYWVPGSGNDVPVIGEGNGVRAFVVVESDLDALAVQFHAGDLVGAVPLGTAQAKPKEAAAAALAKALAILVALDADEAGRKAADWWRRNYPRARRWPVPRGKDPGEFYEQHGGDLRGWVLAGLPAVFRVAADVPAETAAETAEDTDERYVLGVSRGGISYILADTPELLARAREEHPEAAPFLRDELRYLKGYTAAELHHVLVAKQVFPEGRVVAGAGSA